MTRLSKTNRCAYIMIFVFVFGCAEIPLVQPTSAKLFHDNLFNASRKDFDPNSVFDLSPAMQDYLNNEVLEDRKSHNVAQALFNALYNKKQLQLEYESSYTRTAIESFNARSANCLSLVLMTAAFAKEIGLGVRYQSVYTPENISRDESTIYYSGHLNIVLGSAGVYESINNGDKSSMVIDFLTPNDSGKQRVRIVTEQTVLSMYMNNRSVEELQIQRLDSAYWWIKQAIENDPTFLAAYNTLGVIYERNGNLSEAEQALRYVLEMDPVNHAALDNLSNVVLKLGDKEESDRLQKMLRQLVPTPPFYYFDLGMVAMKSKNYKMARDYFTMEIRRSANDSEFNFWLAAAYIGLDEKGKARKHLIIAKENATTTKERELYSLKLKELNMPHKY